jgi:uncharacterized protein YdbL (DUF1318 family)
MKPKQASFCVLVACLLGNSGCITINVYFPEKEIQEAAEKIVEEVRPDIPVEEPEPAAEGSREATAGSSFFLVAALALATTEGLQAEDEEGREEEDEGIEIKIDTARIQAIKKTLKQRYPKLLPFYVKGAVGEAQTGYLVARDIKGLSRRELRDLKILLEEEKKDRKELYMEIAEQNSIEESMVPRIGRLFSREWQKQCKKGWWIQNRKGEWLKKKTPEKQPPEKTPPEKKPDRESA